MKTKMKITPEHKASRDYGKALGELKRFKLDHSHWLCLNNLERRHVWRSEEAYACESQNIVNKHAQLIRNAWQKRAECRSWVPLERRRCKTCRYRDESPDFETCDNCTQGIFINDFCNWEPRKEGE